jgi:BRCT domain type II-containing protein
MLGDLAATCKAILCVACDLTLPTEFIKTMLQPYGGAMKNAIKTPTTFVTVGDEPG